MRYEGFIQLSFKLRMWQAQQRIKKETVVDEQIMWSLQVSDSSLILEQLVEMDMLTQEADANSVSTKFMLYCVLKTGLVFLRAQHSAHIREKEICINRFFFMLSHKEKNKSFYIIAKIILSVFWPIFKMTTI